MSYNTNLKAIFPEIWFEIFCRCGDLKDVVRLWIAFGLRKVITKQSDIWILVFQNFLTRVFHNNKEAGGDIVDSVHRLRRPCLDISLTGLDLLAQLYKVRKCSRSGCLQPFTELENHSHACKFHTGRMRAGYLSCCRAKSFRAVGCKEGHHDGDFFDYTFSMRPEEEKSSSVLLPAPSSAESQQSLMLPSIHNPNNNHSRPPDIHELNSRGKQYFFGTIPTEDIRSGSIKLLHNSTISTAVTMPTASDSRGISFLPSLRS